MAARKRTQAQYEEDLAIVSDLKLRGYTIDQMMDHINYQRRGLYQISRNQIKSDLRKLAKLRKEVVADNVTELFNREMMRFDVIERVAWQQFEAAQAGVAERRKITRARVKDELGHYDLVDVSEELWTEDMSSEAREWFKQILTIQQQRRDFMKIGPPPTLQIDVHSRHESVQVIKAYHEWSPSDWPDAPERKQILEHQP